MKISPYWNATPLFVLALVGTSACSGKSEPPKDPRATFYTLETKVDPITDNKSQTLSAELNSSDNQNFSDISWTCYQTQSADKENWMELTITSFAPTKDGRMPPAPFDNSSDLYAGPVPVKTVMARFNDDKPQKLTCQTLSVDPYVFYPTCKYNNSITVDPVKFELTPRTLGEGPFMANADDKLTWQYVVGGVAYNYTAPINGQVADLFNQCFPEAGARSLLREKALEQAAQEASASSETQSSEESAPPEKTTEDAE